MCFPSDKAMLAETKEHFSCEIEEAPLDDPEELADIVERAQKAPQEPK